VVSQLTPDLTIIWSVSHDHSPSDISAAESQMLFKSAELLMIDLTDGIVKNFNSKMCNILDNCQKIKIKNNFGVEFEKPAVWIVLFLNEIPKLTNKEMDLIEMRKFVGGSKDYRNAYTTQSIEELSLDEITREEIEQQQFV
jgi:hypothetical protein